MGWGTAGAEVDVLRYENGRNPEGARGRAGRGQTRPWPGRAGRSGTSGRPRSLRGRQARRPLFDWLSIVPVETTPGISGTEMLPLLLLLAQHGDAQNVYGAPKCVPNARLPSRWRLRSPKPLPCPVHGALVQWFLDSRLRNAGASTSNENPTSFPEQGHPQSPLPNSILTSPRHCTEYGASMIPRQRWRCYGANSCLKSRQNLSSAQRDTRSPKPCCGSGSRLLHTTVV